MEKLFMLTFLMMVLWGKGPQIGPPSLKPLDVNPTEAVEEAPLPLSNIIAEKDAQTEEVLQAQKILKKLNYDFLVPSGILDEETQKALLNFEAVSHLTISEGNLTDQTLDALIKTLENRYQKNPQDLLVLVNKTHYLKSDYAPSDLMVPKVPFCIGEMKMRKEAAEMLEKMFAAAKEEGITLVARSGYRAYGTQEAVFERNIKRSGLQKALTYSARPGQSEHQTGLAMDITAKSVNNRLVENFETTKEFEWLSLHAHEFGFILRYPKGREEDTGYQYEPWHYRYVGPSIAAHIHEKNLILEDYLNALP